MDVKQHKPLTAPPHDDVQITTSIAPEVLLEKVAKIQDELGKTRKNKEKQRKTRKSKEQQRQRQTTKKNTVEKKKQQLTT